MAAGAGAVLCTSVAARSTASARDTRPDGKPRPEDHRGHCPSSAHCENCPISRHLRQAKRIITLGPIPVRPNPRLRVGEHDRQSIRALILLRTSSALSLRRSKPVFDTNRAKSRSIKPPLYASKKHTGLTVYPQSSKLCRDLNDTIAARGAHTLIPLRKHIKLRKPAIEGTIARNEAIQCLHVPGVAPSGGDAPDTATMPVSRSGCTGTHCVQLSGQSLIGQGPQDEIRNRIAVFNRYPPLAYPSQRP